MVAVVVVVVTKGAASKLASPNYLQHVLFVNAISSALLLFASILYLQKCVAHCYFGTTTTTTTYYYCSVTTARKIALQPRPSCLNVFLLIPKLSAI